MRILLLVAVVFIAAVPAAAQEQTIPRIEAGADVSSFQVIFWPTDVGGGGRLTVALTPLLAIDTRVRLFGDQPISDITRGGRTLQVFSGARATFLSKGRFTLYGLLTPGLIHYSRTVSLVSSDMAVYKGATHLAIDMGVRVSMRLREHWNLQGEWTGPLYAVDGFSELSTFPPAAERGIRNVIAEATIQSSTQFAAGVSYVAGSLGRQPEPNRRGSWLAGGDVGMVAYAPVLAGYADVIKATRVGGFTSIPLTAWMDADVGGDVYLRVDNSHSSNEGGRISQALAGVKLGRRSGRLGYFGKIRAGVQSHSKGLLAAPDYFNQPPPYGPPVFGRIYRPALDIGTVIETSLSHRFVWRVDVSDVIAFFPAKPVRIGDHVVTNPALPAADQIMVTTGLAWRFGGR